MTNLQIAGLFGIGIAIAIGGVAWGYDQYQKRKTERERFLHEIARLEKDISDLDQMYAESQSRLRSKDEQNRALIEEIMRLREELESYRVALWYASA
ncbi:MAG: hypothetical protein F4Y39_08865 [Gemmatimonadetes bacterium]|nr:hypothetical protein [Gemmatimonadota bacterium]MYF74973.1 hypothetical protein [Gemmatimonadota bacterium]MYK54749.1 hypothetical protein [Gemmatimonadota bacterium]